MTKMVKIKTNSAFVGEDGKFINAGEIVVVSEDFLATQNKLCAEFGIVQHEFIAEAEPVAEVDAGQGENAEAEPEKQPETEAEPEKTGKRGKGKGDAASTSDDL